MLNYNLRVLYQYAVVAVGLLLSSTQSPHGMNIRSPFGTAAPVVNVASKCDFEDENICGWTHGNNHDFEWHRHNFGTPSGHVGTGPSHDHTHGDGNSGFYMYIEASSPRKENDTARLYSPVYSSQLSLTACFEFWYHMYGATSGYLRVYLKPESVPFTRLKPLFELQGDQGNDWKRGEFQVPQLEENFQIIIEGVRGPSYVSDTAVDDVYLLKDNCPATTTNSLSTDFTSVNATVTRHDSSTLNNFLPMTSTIMDTEMTTVFSSIRSMIPSTSDIITTELTTTPSTSLSLLKSTSASTSKLNPSTISTPKILPISSNTNTSPTTSKISLGTTQKSIFVPTKKPVSISNSENSSQIITEFLNKSALPSYNSSSRQLPSTVISITKLTVVTKSIRATAINYTPLFSTLQTSIFDDNQPLPPKARSGAKETPVIPIAVGASIGILSIIVIIIVSYHIIKRRKVVQGKLDEDSELRYLANDVEYSDPSNVPEPQMT